MFNFIRDSYDVFAYGSCLPYEKPVPGNLELESDESITMQFEGVLLLYYYPSTIFGVEHFLFGVSFVWS